MTASAQPSSFRWAGLVHILTSNIGANVCGFASGVVMARVLGPEGRGLYQTGALLWAVVPGLLTLSLGTALAIAPRLPPRTWTMAMAAVFTMAGVVLMLALAFFGVIPWWMGFIFAATAVGYMTSDLVQGLLRRREQYGSLAAFRWIDVGGGAAVVVVLAVLGFLTPASAVAALCLTTVVAVAVTTTRLLRDRGLEQRGAFKWTGVAGIHSGTVLRVLASWTDQLLIAALLGASPLGLYAIANAVAVQFLVLPAAVNTVLLRHAHLSRSAGLRALTSFTGALFWAAVVGAVLLWFAGPFFFTIVFGAEFAASGRLAALLLFASLFTGLLLMAETFLVAQGQARFAATARLWSLPALAVSGAALALTRDLSVAVLVPLAANLLPLGVVVARISRTTDTPLSSFVSLPRPSALTALMGRRAKPPGVDRDR